MNLHKSILDPDLLKKTLNEFKEIIDTIEGLVDYPVEPLIRVIKELGETLADNEEYDKLFEAVICLAEKRKSEASVGLMRLERGYQKLRAGKTYDAIKFLGLAQQKLAKHEYRYEHIKALVGCASAYESAGLLWAARANMLVAANQALNEFAKHGKIVSQTLPCIQRLIWLELQLGRVPQTLAWMEMASVISNQIMITGDYKDAFIKERETQDIILGLLLLKSELWELKWLDFMPALMENMGLINSWMALLYALGHEQQLRKEKVIPADQDQQSVKDFFLMWLKQPANNDLPDRPEFLRESHIRLCSFVLGCEIIVETPNNLTSIYLSEAILGALESFLSTGLDKRIIPHRANFHIKIKQMATSNGFPTHQLLEIDGEPFIEIYHPLIMEYRTPEEKQKIHSWLIELIANIIAHIAVLDNVESCLDELARDEVGFGRIFDFVDIQIVMYNLLGNSPKFTLSDWRDVLEADAKRFGLQREAHWYNNHIETKPIKKEISQPRFGKGEPPDDLRNIDNLKHRDRRVLSLINIPLWDKAEWKGVMYGFHTSIPPFIALGFKNIEAAKAIFSRWRAKLGTIDKEEQIRIAIITGVNKNEPATYRVIISNNLQAIGKNNAKLSHFIVVSRINEMNPLSTQNLDNFLHRYRQSKQYLLLPAHFQGDMLQSKPLFEFGIVKREIHIRPAWEIGENDPDILAVYADDNPILPEGINNPPIVSALRKAKKRRDQKNN
jgi:hypothetical protein